MCAEECRTRVGTDLDPLKQDHGVEAQFGASSRDRLDRACVAVRIEVAVATKQFVERQRNEPNAPVRKPRRDSSRVLPGDGNRGRGLFPTREWISGASISRAWMRPTLQAR